MALDLTKTFAEVFGSERTTGQTCIDSDGNLKWALHNLYDNGTGGAQNITVESGVDYTIRAATGSIAYSNAATGTLATGGSVSRVEVTAGSTTLTITPTAATEIAVYRSDLGGMQFDRYGSDYLPNTTGAALYQVGVAHDANGAVIGGQFFEGRTNLVPNSTPGTGWTTGSATITSAAAVSPTGASDASSVNLSLAGFIFDTCSVSASTDYIFSWFIKAGTATAWVHGFYDETNTAFISRTAYDITDGVSVGNGYYRFSATVTTPSGCTSLRVYPVRTSDAGGEVSGAVGTSIVWGCQLEAGASVSPVIPTSGSTVTRGADRFPKATSTFGYNQSEGFVVAEFQSAGSDGADTPFIFIADDGTANNRLAAYLNTSNAAIAASTVGGAAQAAESAGSYTPDALSKIAYGMKADDFAVSLDGGTIATDTSGTMSGSVTNFEIGTGLNGYIKRLIYCPFKPDNTTIVEEAT